MRTTLLIGALLLVACQRSSNKKAEPEAEPASGPVAAAGDESAALPSDAQPADAPTPQGPPELVAIDLFGTSQITREVLLDKLGKELRERAERALRQGIGLQGDTILEEIAKLGDFAYVEPAMIGYFEPEGMKYYLTIDLVDKKDAARRMRFAPEPTGTHEDPDGLIADWDALTNKIFELMGSGEMSAMRVECPALHCFGDHSHPAVKDLAARIAARAPAHRNELAAILRDDRRESYRADAAYLLAYTDDGPGLVALMVPAFRDSSSYVRNSAMRVVSDIAAYHPEIEVPLEPVLDALEYPATTDRNKASAILDSLLDRAEVARQRISIARRSGATLIAMLRLEQPNNHDFAYSILKKLSVDDLGERDYARWEAWLAKLKSAPPAR